MWTVLGARVGGIRRLPHSWMSHPHHPRGLATSSGRTSSVSLKKLIQPFILKCHPDMAAQQGLPKTAVQVNLKAIQNLNSYIDGVTALEKAAQTTAPIVHPFSNRDIIDIEFVMSFSATTPVAAHPTTSRRRVELQVPPSHLPATQVTSLVQKQVLKLLRMADLPIPHLDHDDDNDDLEDDGLDSSQEGVDEEYLATQVVKSKTAWDRSRDRFLRRVNWTKFDKVYQQALRDAQASIETRGLIRDNPKLRQQFLARILSHVQFTEAVSPLERLVAYRRLVRLLDEQFDYLQLETFGKYWEELEILITESRPYNTSSTAMRKRRERHLETGYRFTIHHDNSVTVQIPVDFRDDELLEELHRNIKDFYEWTHQDGWGLGGIFDEENVIL